MTPRNGTSEHAHEHERMTPDSFLAKLDNSLQFAKKHHTSLDILRLDVIANAFMLYCDTFDYVLSLPEDELQALRFVHGLSSWRQYCATLDFTEGA